MKTVRITAKTIEAAVEEGLKQLGISRAEAVVHVVERPSNGLFGLFNKKDAVVEISAPELEGDISAEVKAEAEKEGTVFEQAVSSLTEASDKVADTVQETVAAALVGADKLSEKAAEITSDVKDQVEEAVFDAKEKVKDVLDGDNKEAAEKKEKRLREEAPFSAEEQAEAAEEAKRFLNGVFSGMKMEVQIEKMVNEERILFNLHGDGLGILIGKHGQTLDALQYLTNLAANKNFRHHYFVLLDVEDYRERRKQTLESLAHRLASKVKRTGEDVRLEPMAAGERRIIHLALQNDAAVSTESDGEPPYRCVVIRAK